LVGIFPAWMINHVSRRRWSTNTTD